VGTQFRVRDVRANEYIVLRCVERHLGEKIKQQKTPTAQTHANGQTVLRKLGAARSYINMIQ
jgi:hypothetical protein